MRKLAFFLSTPISSLEKEISWLKENRFNPEVRMANVEYIMNLDVERLRDLGNRLKENGLSVFTHGPFFGLDIASMDSHISEYTFRSMLRGLEVTAALGADVMVIHSGLLPFFSRGGRRHWFGNWSQRMVPVLDRAGEMGIRVALENSWEDRPQLLERLIELIPSGKLYACIDTGHLNTFSRFSIDKWWERLGDSVIAIHLHDNDGLSDDHLPPGRGTFDFQRLGELLARRSEMPLLDLEIDRNLAGEGREYLERVWASV